ncbi:MULTISPECIES: hypothetical protein [Prochlorococcus]|uniref:hypothetical protein n=1 Tax=Prochlorococcus TaxID=1218 RepID=UPI000698524C|nr:hypothetical protein [Prochlorococcus marinus]
MDSEFRWGLMSGGVVNSSIAFRHQELGMRQGSLLLRFALNHGEDVHRTLLQCLSPRCLA